MKTAHRVNTLSFAFYTASGEKVIKHVSLILKTKKARKGFIDRTVQQALDWESQRQGRKVYVWAQHGFSTWRLSKAADVLASIY